MSELPQVVTPESLARAEINVCLVSAEAARQITAPLVEQITNPLSVIYSVAADRASRMGPDSRLAIAPILHVDPTRSGAVAARYMLQGGVQPAGSAASPEQAVILWMAQDKDDIPPLRIPKGEETRTMVLADSMQMRGGGPVIFERAEIRSMNISSDGVVLISAAANLANMQRIITALEIAAHHTLDRPLVITTDPTRILMEKELNTVSAFAPDARNEHQLVIDSARAEGFVLDSSLYGVTCLPDGSLYQSMTHVETGQRLVVLAPAKVGKTGVDNAYRALAKHGAVVFDDADFVLDGANITQVTGTHYGAMAVMNNLDATIDQRIQLASFTVVGDNQPATRGPQAHLIEVGLTLNAFDEITTRYPALRRTLLGELYGN